MSIKREGNFRECKPKDLAASMMMLLLLLLMMIIRVVAISGSLAPSKIRDELDHYDHDRARWMVTLINSERA